MLKREKVPAEKSASPGQVGNLIALIAPQLSFTSEEADRIANNPPTTKRFVSKMRRLLDEFRFSGTVSLDVVGTLSRWTSNYQRLFGKTPDLSGLHIPEKPKGHGPMRLIVVAREILDWTRSRPLQGTLEALEKHFRVEQWDKSDFALVRSDRGPDKGTYACWTKDVVGAGEENANKSADDLFSEGHIGITLLERQFFEADVFFERGVHLDQRSLSLCSGSRGGNVRVPYVSWDDDAFSVRWISGWIRASNLRSRRVWA